MKNKAAVASAVIFILMCLYCLLIPGFWKIPGIWTSLKDYDPNAVDFSQSYAGFSLDHPFSTDKFGRDLFARVAVGGQISIAIGFAATFAILVIGVVYGSISGFVGGKLDNGMMRFLDALYGLPYLPFAIITTQILSPTGSVSFSTMVVALTIASWFTTARVVRGQVITLKENDYIRAAKAVGARWYRVLGRHLLPNTLGVLIIAIFLELPGVILGEAILSFIGLGISPPKASWGTLAEDGYAAYQAHPYIIIIPSLMIAWLILSAFFVADGLRDALDPRTRET
jgi:oligopeptide transport system permease protein